MNTNSSITSKSKQLKSSGFIQIPHQIVGDNRLSDFQKILYGLIYSYSKGKYKSCFASNAKLAQLLGKSSNDTITKAIKGLNVFKLIDIENPRGPKRKIKTSNIKLDTILAEELREVAKETNDDNLIIEPPMTTESVLDYDRKLQNYFGS